MVQATSLGSKGTLPTWKYRRFPQGKLVSPTTCSEKAKDPNSWMELKLNGQFIKWKIIQDFTLQRILVHGLIPRTVLSKI